MSSPYKYIPNILTVLRLLGTPLTFWGIIEGQFRVAFWLFLAVCLTDWLDGYLARRWQATSKLGQLLDPLADKFLLISTYLALTLEGFIPLWLTALVALRDFLILMMSGGIILLRQTTVAFVPHLIGKISTTLQMLFVGLVLAGEVPIFPFLPPSGVKGILMVSLLYGVAFITVLSGLSYGWVAFTLFRKQ